MEITQNELVQALERAQEHGMNTAQSLADFVVGYRAALNGDAAATLNAPATTILWPDVLRTEEDVLLEWPDGTRVVDTDGDGYVRYKGVWVWDTWRGGNMRLSPDEFDNHVRYGSEGSNSTLIAALPAHVASIGTEVN